MALLLRLYSGKNVNVVYYINIKSHNRKYDFVKIHFYIVHATGIVVHDTGLVLLLYFLVRLIPQPDEYCADYEQSRFLQFGTEIHLPDDPANADDFARTQHYLEAISV